jgi:hypothetical protein
MQGAEAQRIVAEELRHIPHGSMAQNAFRAAYSAYRQHDLSVDLDAPPTRALASAEASVRVSRPDFVSRIDDSFFRGSPMPVADCCM